MISYTIKVDKPQTYKEKLTEAAHLQALEGNPLDEEDLAMFEMFEREGWSQEKRLDYIRKRALEAAEPHQR